jgi:flagellar basal body rod protein FlgC
VSEMDLLAGAARGMNAQRAVLDIAARNVAAAQASSPGHTYARLVAEIADAPQTGDDDDIDDDGVTSDPLVRTRTEAGTGDALTEMIAVLDAQRAYESDASIFDVGKRLAERTIDIGRG